MKQEVTLFGQLLTQPGDILCQTSLADHVVRLCQETQGERWNMCPNVA